MSRKIIHVDMDAFYASVEQRDLPSLKGRPVVVGGPPQSRSVVASASYEARKFGIRSAMSCAQAQRLCPEAIFVTPRFEAYKLASAEIMAIFREYTELVEPLSLDEAFLDVTNNKLGIPSATWIADEIRKKIFQRTSLTASAGVAPNKFLAKIASDLQKPNGLTVIPPERVSAILATLPVGKVPGIGRKTEEKMHSLGVHTTHDLAKISLEELREHFGKSGEWFYRIARGDDDREVSPRRERKSVGAEDTFPSDLLNWDILELELQKIAKRVFQRLKGAPGRTVTLKVTYAGFEKCTRGTTLEHPVQSDEELLALAVRLLEETEATKRPIRLLGITVSNFVQTDVPRPEGKQQLGIQLSFKW